jgi:ABC-type phosphate/phosphonate transport system ATPase subunit
MLRIENLEKRYQTGDLALKSVNLEVPRGQVMALIGPSGAGKSTLIRCVNRLVEPTAGKIFLGDLELAQLGSSALRRARTRMGMIFQEYALVERLSVMEVSAMSASGAAIFAGFRKPTSTPRLTCCNVSGSTTWPTSAPTNYPAGSVNAWASAVR